MQHMGNLCLLLSEYATILLLTGNLCACLMGCCYQPDVCSWFAFWMSSKSPVNQATSKAMLTQMISIIFRRMETDPVWKLIPLFKTLLYNKREKIASTTRMVSSSRHTTNVLMSDWKSRSSLQLVLVEYQRLLQHRIQLQKLRKRT